MAEQASPKMATRTPQRVLVIVAHPDDIEFGTAGSVARWTDAGAQVTYAIITDGAAGSNEPDADLAALARTRHSEQCEAAETVGVTDVRFLGYADGALQPTLDLRRDLTRLIREVKPDRVVIQDPTTVLVEDRYINHPDHRAAGEAALYAVFPSAETRPIFPELLAEGFEPHHVTDLYLMLTLHPDTFVDITASMDRKIKALLAHKTQVGPDIEKMLREWDAEDGKKVGCDYAESFRVMKLSDDEDKPVE
jgi:LmbE family N-acetylglucosaminyl deacetylase